MTQFGPNAHALTCPECGTPHVCPGPPEPPVSMTVERASEYLVGHRLYEFWIKPLIDDVTEIEVKTDEGHFTWRVDNEVETGKIREMLFKAIKR